MKPNETQWTKIFSASGESGWKEFQYTLPEGDFQIVLEYDKDTGGMDWSTGLQMYKKVGLAVVTNPNYWGIYQNTALV